MVLLDLGKNIHAAIQKLATRRTVDEKVLDEILKDICRALLEADVNVRLVQRLRQNIKAQLDLEVLSKSSNKKRIIQRAIFDELLRIVQVKTVPFQPVKGQVNVIMFVGLQGSGKTTSCTKLAAYYVRKGFKVGLVCGDTFRAGAFDQLKQNATKAKIPFYGSYAEADPVKIVSEGFNKFRSEGFEIIIVDTSGKHKQEEELFKEMKEIGAVARPDFVIYVMDSSIGQAAELQATAFKQAIPIGGIILTKMDGSSKGGGALSAIAATGSSVCFIGTGEHLNDFEAFDAKGFVGKLLGMGDVSGFIEKMSEVAQSTSQEKTLAMAERMNQGTFLLEDLYEQLQMMLSMGPIGQIMAMIPGMNADLLGPGKDEDITKRFRSFVVIMNSMTRSELSSDGKMFTTQPSRIRRIARGSGCPEERVNELLQHYRKYAQVIKKLGASGKGGLFQNMSKMMSGRQGRGSPAFPSFPANFDFSQLQMPDMTQMAQMNQIMNSTKGRRIRNFHGPVMNFEENRIRATLTEVEVFDGLREQRQVSGEYFSRRAYLSKKQRDELANLSTSALANFFAPGEPLHVPMLDEEKATIFSIYNFNGKKFTKSDINIVADLLPGRRSDDILNFMTDCQENAVESKYLTFKIDKADSIVPLSFLNRSATLKLEKQFSIVALNNSVSTIAIRTKPNTDGRVIVGGCTIDAIEYNGPELLAIKHNKTINEYTSCLLDGHRTILPRTNECRRETVMCAVYDEGTDTFITGGYDGRVVSWNAESLAQIAAIASHAPSGNSGNRLNAINSISTHRSSNCLAYGVKMGAVFVTRMPTEAEPDITSRCLFKKPSIPNHDQNTVDHVIIPKIGPKTDVCYAGIGHYASAKGGIIEAYDLNTFSLVSTSEVVGKGLSCMQISPNGRFIAAGSGCIIDNVKGDGIIHIFNTFSDLKNRTTIHTKMYDMDAVTFCPRNELLFASDCSNSQWSVHDLRFPANPLFSSSHFMLRDGETQNSEIVAHCWFKGGDYLATGGHDETVKIWDCRRSFDLVDTFTFTNGISELKYSEHDDALIVGTDSGQVVYIAKPGHLPDNHPRELEATYQ